MKITMIHGQNHKGSTYTIGKMLAEAIGGEVTEFFLPRDFSEYCVGCSQCFLVSEEKCLHFEQQQAILRAMDAADVIILTSPVYVYHASAPMKNFLDHQGHRWMVHRPKPEMFRKQAVCISTAAGGGMKSTNRDMADSLFYWGVAKIYRLGFAVRAINWQGVSREKKLRIRREVLQTAAKIRANAGVVQPGLKTKAFFHFIRMMNRKGKWNAVDGAYWKAQGWLDKGRPWKA